MFTRVAADQGDGEAQAAIWVGGLLVLATAARPLFGTGRDRAYAVKTAERLSRLAGLSLLGVAATGTYNAVTQNGELSALWETAYGRLLLLTVAGVLGMVGLGAFNRYRGLPRLRDWARGSPESRSAPPGGERFLRIATLESPGDLGPRVHGSPLQCHAAARGVMGRRVPGRRGRCGADKEVKANIQPFILSKLK
ncbi:MAG: copper resistance D family protein [Gammaproteobacteria bacterium]